MTSATCSYHHKFLFSEDDEDGLQEEHSNSLIPAQDLTRVGNTCWHLGDLFNKDTTEVMQA